MKTAKQPDVFMQEWINFIYNLQDRICAALEELDTITTFKEETWDRPGGGGGRTRVIENGQVFEKGGVNVSYVHGLTNNVMKQQLGIEGHYWAACGLSMVIHPINPWVPTFHANWRYFELYDEQDNTIDQWFGGGMDLTPYYVIEEDAKLFHNTLKQMMATFSPDFYPKFKKNCDEYFNNHHRGTETRGIGGVFYDHLRPNDENGMNLEQLFAFQQANAESFFATYIPIAKSRMEISYSAEQKFWQEIRRGRYVEFNLLHDKGTLFGLRTDGRVESILMSLPPTVRFNYNYIPEEGSDEAKSLEIFQIPREWAE